MKNKDNQKTSQAKSKGLSHEDYLSLNIPFQDSSHLYKALMPLECFKCKKIIQTKEIFSRFADKAGAKPGIRYIFCSECRTI